MEEALYDVGSGLGLRTAVVIGGASMRPQLKALAANPHIIIATPGRLNDYLNQKAVNLGRTRMVVLDEADPRRRVACAGVFNMRDAVRTPPESFRLGATAFSLSLFRSFGVLALSA